jgi:hypothetical protein
LLLKLSYDSIEGDQRNIGNNVLMKAIQKKKFGAAISLLKYGKFDLTARNYKALVYQL